MENVTCNPVNTPPPISGSLEALVDPNRRCNPKEGYQEMDSGKEEKNDQSIDIPDVREAAIANVEVSSPNAIHISTPVSPIEPSPSPQAPLMRSPVPITLPGSTIPSSLITSDTHP
ncbi:hypothetical protein Clacol_008882 [Clathrus columnatus]|uniref:Uncharacterized protein n=1 Tax=Clathrus columnatus TaxID=1419009 RepID=A0AAV5AQF8_9AGAM|nr:hypothetical protein Clacol_008882 [Clathrus columnatus]